MVAWFSLREVGRPGHPELGKGEGRGADLSPSQIANVWVNYARSAGREGRA